MMMKTRLGSAVQPDPELLAIQALSFLAGDPERLTRFLGITGLDPAGLRIAAREPRFLASVLAYLLADEALLLAFAANQQLSPEAVLAASAKLDKNAAG